MTPAEENQKWERLLSCRRINDILQGKQEQECKTEPRNPYERDCDRITYSYPFRRLQDKTQVIPLPVLDFVHTRLTHTLEVATVGRSLGRMLENFLLRRKVISDDKRGDIPAIVTAACLSHDIGNPPFGHSGEYSISEYFRFGDGSRDLDSDYPPDSLRDKESATYQIQTGNKKNDLCRFEGNAMGFRILTKHDGNGLNLTCATLGAFTKYPRPSFIHGETLNSRWDSNRVSQKKFGVFFSERDIFKRVAEELELVSLLTGGINFAFARHPLAFLMEAADDICYRIIDLEDGFRIERIPFVEAERYMLTIAQADERFNTSDYNSLTDEKKKFGYLRSRSINYLVHQCFDVFIENYDQILNGTFDKELLKGMHDKNALTATEEIYKLVKKYLYQWKDVLLLEATGFEVLSGLVSDFIEASKLCIGCDPSVRSKRAEKIFDILPEEFRHTDNEDPYSRYLKVASYVSGMTDGYALSLFRKIRGIQNLSR